MFSYYEWVSDDDTKKLEDLLKKTIRPVKELVEVLKSKVDKQQLYLVTTSSDVKSIKEQQSVMNEKLDAHGEKLEILWDQVERVTVDLTEVKEAQSLHTAVLNRIESKVDNNSEDTKKLDKRLAEVESDAGIVPPPELTVN